MTGLVSCGPAPIQGGSSSSTDVLVVSSAAVSISFEDMVQTNVPVPSDVGIQPSNNLPILVQLDRRALLKARPDALSN